MHHTIAAWVAEYGVVLVFLLVGLEGLGVPLPGETALVTAAALAATGRVWLPAVIVSAALGSSLGSTAGYWIGRRGGAALLHRHGRRFRISEERMRRAHAFVVKRGVAAVFVGRFIAILRTWAAILAGAGEMPFARFTVANVLGAAAWSVVFGLLGYSFGAELPRLQRYVGRASLMLALLVALGVAVLLAWRWFAANRAALAARTEALWRRATDSRAARRFRAEHPKLWTWVVARFARGEYLGLHLTIGFAISVFALWVFAAITEDVVTGDPLTRFDLALNAWFRAHSTPLGLSIFSDVSLVGSPVAMAALLLAGVLWLAWRREWIVLAGWCAAFVGGGLLDLVLKDLIRRPRPAGAFAFLHGQSWSFPSGHAMGSLIGYGMLAYLIIAGLAPHRRAQVSAACAALVLVFLIGFSRLYLGVHYFSDVVGGFAAGSLWLAACASGIEIARRQRQMVERRGTRR